MSEESTNEALRGMRGMVVANTSEEGVDVVNVYAQLIDVLKADPSITIETWELMKMGINHGALIACNLIDEEIAKLREEE